MKNVPIAKALILSRPISTTLPPVVVLRIGEEDNRDYLDSGGAAYQCWKEANTTQQCLLLFIEFQSLVYREGISPIYVHKAFLCIPEYCMLIAEDIDGHKDQTESFERAMAVYPPGRKRVRK